MGEEPSMPVIVERIKNVQDDVTDIKLNMATKTDQAHIDQRIANLTGALEKESAERKSDIAAERKERQEDVAGVRNRLQVVEDRTESRKYLSLSALFVAAVGLVFGIFRDMIPPFGG